MEGISRDALFHLWITHRLSLSLAKTGQRLGKIFETIEYVKAQSAKRITTGKVNEALAEFVAVNSRHQNMAVVWNYIMHPRWPLIRQHLWCLSMIWPWFIFLSALPGKQTSETLISLEHRFVSLSGNDKDKILNSICLFNYDERKFCRSMAKFSFFKSVFLISFC